MRRFILIILLYAILTGSLSGCNLNQAKNNETTPHPEQTNPTEQKENQINAQSLGRPQDRGECFVETEDAYYYLNNKMVYMSQKTEPSFYYLCGKPDCPHSGPDCNAYGGYWLGYWEEKLYTVQEADGELLVCRMNLDGTAHDVKEALDNLQLRH